MAGDRIIRHIQVRPGVWLKAEVAKDFERRHSQDIIHFARGIGSLFAEHEWEIEYDPLEWVD